MWQEQKRVDTAIRLVSITIYSCYRIITFFGKCSYAFISYLGLMNHQHDTKPHSVCYSIHFCMRSTGTPFLVEFYSLPCSVEVENKRFSELGSHRFAWNQNSTKMNPHLVAAAFISSSLAHTVPTESLFVFALMPFRT